MEKQQGDPRLHERRVRDPLGLEERAVLRRRWGLAGRRRPCGARAEGALLYVPVASRARRARSGTGSISRSRSCVMRLPCWQPLTEDQSNLPAAAAIFSARGRHARRRRLRAAGPRWVCVPYVGRGFRAGLPVWGGASLARRGLRGGAEVGRVWEG